MPRITGSRLALGLFLLCIGCSNSSRKHVAVGSSAAPVNSTTAPGATPSTSQPAFSMQSVTPTSAARQQQGMALYNQEIADLWARLLPGIEQRALAEAQAANLNTQAGPVTIAVGQVHSVDFVAPIPPGFHQLTHDRLTLAIPLQGGMTIRVVLDVTATFSVAGIPITTSLPITLEINDLNVTADVEIDGSDPTRPVVRRLSPPQAGFTLAIQSPNPIAQNVFGALNQVAGQLVNLAIGVAMNALVVPSLPGYPGGVWADGTPPLTDSGRPVAWDTIAENVDVKLRNDHAPHGTVLRVRMDTPIDDESWEDAYGPGGPGNTGNVVTWNGGGDSAFNTGYGLAAAAFRYAAKGGDPIAMDAAAWYLRGIGALIDVNGSTGLLARVAGPETSLVGQEIVRRGVFRRAQLFGQTWVCRQGDNGVSRDQYTAVCFGLAIAHELIPALRPEIELRVQQMLDYLIAEGWIITEDRPWLTAGQTTPTPFMVQSPYQQVCLLTIGERMHPGRYAAERQRLEALTSIVWVGAWMSVAGLDSYYKFNLQMLNMYNYFRHETDRTRWMDMARSYRITQRWVGHHQNPHFDAIQCGVDPSLRATLHPAIREELRLFLTRNHRERVPPGLNTSVVQWQQWTFASATSPTGSVETVPTAPLPIPLRKYTGYYQWQKQPVRLAVYGTGPDELTKAYSEKPGLDYTLPYWMAREQGF